MAFGFGGGGGEGGGGNTFSVSAVVSACIAAVSLGAAPASAPASTFATAPSADTGPAFQGTEVTVAPPTGPSI